jgi:SM-20-related protein
VGLRRPLPILTLDPVPITPLPLGHVQTSEPPSPAAASSAAVEPVPVFVLDGFMTEEIAGLRDYAERHPGDFHPAKVGGSAGGRADHSRRQALVMYPGPLARQVRERVTATLPRAQQALGLPVVPAERVDVQITASPDGGFYKRHTDSSSGPAASRKISYVLFVHRSPRAFTGGELVLYPHGPADLRAGRRAISPETGRIVFFPSGLLHEIMPVHAPGGLIEQARLTVNGWIH